MQTKGVSKEQAIQMFNGATNMAREAGIDFNLEAAIPANSFMAHRLIQFANSKDLGNEIEEVLFKAHFEEGKNIDDIKVLVQVAKSIGMDAEEVENVLNSDAFAYEVKQDEMEAGNIGVSGVPFFFLRISTLFPEHSLQKPFYKPWKSPGKRTCEKIQRPGSLEEIFFGNNNCN